MGGMERDKDFSEEERHKKIPLQQKRYFYKNIVISFEHFRELRSHHDN